MELNMSVTTPREYISDREIKTLIKRNHKVTVICKFAESVVHLCSLYQHIDSFTKLY